MTSRDRAGVNRDARLTPRRGALPSGSERNPVLPIGLHRYCLVFEGADAGAGVTSIELKHGGISVRDLGVPVPSTMRTGPVAATFLATGSPLGDSWTLTLEVRQPKSDVFEDKATFEVNN